MPDIIYYYYYSTNLVKCLHIIHINGIQYIKIVYKPPLINTSPIVFFDDCYSTHLFTYNTYKRYTVYGIKISFLNPGPVCQYLYVSTHHTQPS